MVDQEADLPFGAVETGEPVTEQPLEDVVNFLQESYNIPIQLDTPALEDAGLTKNDIDGYFCAGDAPGLGTTTVAEYLGLKLRHVDSTECGGSAPILHVAHAAEAIAAAGGTRGESR